ncbi:cell wall-binding repeat-containing protein [Peptacetobacter sp.]|uniref:cell wall-binding repeat-containing protein n=1 Tax=Peptacetobacter sp. TaxID=2991975 RepID=UPI0026145B53|nr:cell wall-binding repeat-containing protein [Peptacetobacter sp.]
MLKKIMTIMLSATLLMSSIVPISALDRVDRIKGSNNYETASKIADKRNFSSVILVNADKTIADGLSAAALAGATNGVILLTSKDSIPSWTQKKIDKVTEVYIIGDDEAISESIENKIKSDGKVVKRLGGKDRYDTSYQVAEEVKSITGKLEKVFIANGLKGEADIVSTSPVSYREKAPILLTNGKDIKDDIKEIADDSIERFIIGGTAVVSGNVEKRINNSVRIGGKNRFYTNKMIIDRFYSNPKDFNIVDTSDYTIAVISCSISTEKPIVLVDYRHDPIALKEARNITAVGNIADHTISKAIGYSGGLNRFNYDWTKNKYIAHALGGVGGKAYTNSPQAIEHNYNKGFRVFEIDLTFSKDGELIAWHPSSKERLREMGIPEKYASEKPTVSEFKKLKYYGKYNTMTFKEAISYMRKYKDMYLVTDFKDSLDKDVQKLYRKIVEESGQDVIDRIIPQAYTDYTYHDIMKTNQFKSMIFTTYKLKRIDENEITNFCALNGIKVLVIDYRFYTPSLVERCKTKGIKLYMNTYNDQNVVNSYTKKGVSGFYTDFLTP